MLTGDQNGDPGTVTSIWPQSDKRPHFLDHWLMKHADRYAGVMLGMMSFGWTCLPLEAMSILEIRSLHLCVFRRGHLGAFLHPDQPCNRLLVRKGGLNRWPQDLANEMHISEPFLHCFIFIHCRMKWGSPFHVEPANETSCDRCVHCKRSLHPQNMFFPVEIDQRS
jgi:hypothetical protein